jgi:hypothetical protein
VKSYNLEELTKFLNGKYYFSRERFFKYFTALGKTEKAISGFWSVFEHLPLCRDEDEAVIADYVIEKLSEFPRGVSVENHYYEPRKNKKKIFYRTENEIASFEIDLNEAADIILYAEFLKTNQTLIVAVDFIENIHRNDKRINIYDGDIFVTSDRWYQRQDGDVYVCNKGPYQKLLYTQGRGYIRNGKPDFDEKECSPYVLTGKDKFVYVGNIYVDMSFLVESSKSENEEKE